MTEGQVTNGIAQRSQLVIVGITWLYLTILANTWEYLVLLGSSWYYLVLQNA